MALSKEVIKELDELIEAVGIGSIDSDECIDRALAYGTEALEYILKNIENILVNAGMIKPEERSSKNRFYKDKYTAARHEDFRKLSSDDAKELLYLTIMNSLIVGAYLDNDPLTSKDVQTAVGTLDEKQQDSIRAFNPLLAGQDEVYKDIYNFTGNENNDYRFYKLHELLMDCYLDGDLANQKDNILKVLRSFDKMGTKVDVYKNTLNTLLNLPIKVTYEPMYMDKGTYILVGSKQAFMQALLLFRCLYINNERITAMNFQDRLDLFTGELVLLDKLPFDFSF